MPFNTTEAYAWVDQYGYKFAVNGAVEIFNERIKNLLTNPKSWKNAIDTATELAQEVGIPEEDARRAALIVLNALDTQTKITFTLACHMRVQGRKAPPEDNEHVRNTVGYVREILKIRQEKRGKRLDLENKVGVRC